MNLIAYIITLAIVGLVVGALARLALPGRDPLSLLQTMGVGIAGSFLGGLIVRLLAGPDGYSYGWIASLVCATLIVYLIRRSRGGSLTSPGHGDRPGPLGRRRGPL